MDCGFVAQPTWVEVARASSSVVNPEEAVVGLVQYQGCMDTSFVLSVQVMAGS